MNSDGGNSMSETAKRYIDEYFGQTDITELVRTYGSPLYVYQEALLRRRCREMQQLVQGVPFAAHYSVKANTNLELLRIARDEGLHADAMSPGEILALEAAGYAADAIFFIPNNISRDELRFAADRGILISVDSLDQLDLLGSVQPGGRVSLRLNLGIGAGHHEKVITAGDDTKFGITEAQLDQAQAIARQYQLTITGLNQHIGSLFMEPAPYLAAAERLLSAARRFPDLEMIDFGGGFGIPYHKMAGEARLDLAALGSRLSEMAKRFASTWPRPLMFMTEPGRYIAAEAGLLIGTVHAVKQNGPRIYVGTDIGFNVLARPMLYDAWHDLLVIRQGRLLPQTGLETVTVTGNICESGDQIAADRPLPALRCDDLVVVLDAGAYGYSMSSNYNQRLRPAEVLLPESGRPRLIRRRDTYDDLLRGMLFPVESDPAD